MNYKEYYIKCREIYQQENKPTLEEFYYNPVVGLPIDSFGETYMESVEALSTAIKCDFDSMQPDPLMLKHYNIWKYEDLLVNLSNCLVPYLENKRYGCHLYVDKIYVYRTSKLDKLQSSYLWHYDNNPSEIVKNIIYLNDVTELNSPFEFLGDCDEKGLIIQPSRTGPHHWQVPPNNSRITKHQLEYFIAHLGYRPVKVTGSKGLAYSFNNNAVHRVNSVVNGYRDVVNIRVKPCLNKPPRYIDQRWTTDFNKSGAVSSNPEITWRQA